MDSNTRKDLRKALKSLKLQVAAINTSISSGPVDSATVNEELQKMYAVMLEYTSFMDKHYPVKGNSNAGNHKNKPTHVAGAEGTPPSPD